MTVEIFQRTPLCTVIHACHAHLAVSTLMSALMVADVKRCRRRRLFCRVADRDKLLGSNAAVIRVSVHWDYNAQSFRSARVMNSDRQRVLKPHTSTSGDYGIFPHRVPLVRRLSLSLSWPPAVRLLSSRLLFLPDPNVCTLWWILIW